MVRSNPERLRRRAEEDFAGAIRSNGADPQAFLGVTLTYNDPAIPRAEYAIGVAAALAIVPEQAKVDTLMASTVNAANLGRLLHGCALLKDIQGSNPQEITSRFTPQAIRTALQSELNSLYAPGQPDGPGRRYHRDTILKFAAQLGYELVAPQDQTRLSRATRRGAAAALTSFITLSSPNVVAAAAPLPSPSAPANPNATPTTESNTQTNVSAPVQRAGGFSTAIDPRVRKESHQLGGVKATTYGKEQAHTQSDGPGSAEIPVFQAPSTSSSEPTSVASSAAAEATQVAQSSETQPTPSASATSPAAQESTVPTPSYDPTVLPTVPPSSSATPPAPSAEVTKGPVVTTDPLPDPNGAVTGDTTSIPTGPEGVRNTRRLFWSLIPGGSKKVAEQEAPTGVAAVVAEKVTGSILPAGETTDATVVAATNTLASIPLVEAMVKGADQPSRPNAAPVLSAEVKTAVTNDIQAMTSNSALPANDFMQNLERRIQQGSNDESLDTSTANALKVEALVDAGVPQQFAKYYVEYGQKHKISPFILAAQGGGESSWRARAKNPKSGAAGVSQFMSGTFNYYKKLLHFPSYATRYMPRYAIEAQAKMMAELVHTAEKSGLPGDPMRLALAGYNAGWGKVKAAGGHPSYNLNYSKNIVEDAAKFEAKYKAKLAAAKPSSNEQANSAQAGSAELLSQFENANLASYAKNNMAIPDSESISKSDAELLTKYWGVKLVGEVAGYIDGKKHPFLAAEIPRQYTLRGGVITSVNSVGAFTDVYRQLHEKHGMKHIVAGVGFRTNAQQIAARVANKCRDIFNAPAESCETPTARPGHSEHQSPEGATDTFNKRTGNFLHSGNERKHPPKDKEWDTVNDEMEAHGLHNLHTEGWHFSKSGH